MLSRGSATSKAINSIAMFGGTVEGSAPIAGALLQKDVRHAASLAAAASAPRGRGVRRGGHRVDVDGPPALMSASEFVGAGRMGAPMVRRLVEAGHEVDARGPHRREAPAVAELGASRCADLADDGAEADAIVVCVFTDEQVQQVCLDGDLLAAMRPGAALIVHTTGSPRTAEAIAAARTARRRHRAPVSGGPHDIAGGQRHAVRRRDRRRGGAACNRCSARYGDPILHVGPTGAGQQVKLINNTLFAAQIGLVAEAVRLGDAARASTKAPLLGALTHGSAREPGAGHDRRGRLGSTRSSQRSASSSARTSRWCGRPSPNSAAISGVLDAVVERRTSRRDSHVQFMQSR